MKKAIGWLALPPWAWLVLACTSKEVVDMATEASGSTSVTTSGAPSEEATVAAMDETSGSTTMTTASGSSDGSSDGSSGDTCPPEGCECTEPPHEPCDDGTRSLAAAVGLGCPGEPSVEVTITGSSAAAGVRTGFGGTTQWAPREGSAFAVLGSGLVAELDLETPPGDMDLSPTHCNDDLGADFDPGGRLPAPIQPNEVDGDCVTDPALLGTGDCSGTIAGQFNQGGAAFDYTELRIVADVPAGSTSLGFDFAFFSTEYPYYFGSSFNDMYVAWLESERWTGNVSFDASGNPISLNAGFLDFIDDGGTLPEFAGTCMRQHAGTQWLRSIAPVAPGEQITLVMAVFDLADSIVDSYVFVDGFGWSCDAVDRPSTAPAG